MQRSWWGFIIHIGMTNDFFFPLLLLRGNVREWKEQGAWDQRLALNLSSTCYLATLRLEVAHFQFPHLPTDKTLPP